MALISGRMTYSSFYVTIFPIGPLLGVLPYSIRSEEVGSWENLHLYHEEPVGSSVWWSRRSGKEAKKASGIRGTRAPGRRIDRALLGRLAFGPSPFWALGLGRLARGTEPGPMVPTMPPFSCRGGRSSSVGKKKGISLTVIL